MGVEIQEFFCSVLFCFFKPIFSLLGNGVPGLVDLTGGSVSTPALWAISPHVCATGLSILEPILCILKTICPQVVAVHSFTNQQSDLCSFLTIQTALPTF